MNRRIVKLKRELINESQQLYREFSKSLLTISAALIAAIIITLEDCPQEICQY